MNQENKKIIENIDQLIETIKIEEWQQKIEQVLLEYFEKGTISTIINDMELTRNINYLADQMNYFLNKIVAINFQRIQSDWNLYANWINCYNLVQQPICFVISNYSGNYLYDVFCEKMFEKGNLQFAKKNIKGSIIPEKLSTDEFKIYQWIKKEAIIKKYIDILYIAENLVLQIENNPLANTEI